MREVLDDIERWQAGGHRVALARVVGVVGSGPRDPGAAMAVNEDGEVAGSVSGGCVEGAVVSEALEVLASGEPRLCTFGYSDDEAFSVGLTCGGTIRIFVEPSTDAKARRMIGAFGIVRDCLRAGEPVALATVVELSGSGPAPAATQGAVGAGGAGATAGVGAGAAVPPAALPVLGAKVVVRSGTDPLGSLGEPDLDQAVVRDALGALETGLNAIRHYGAHGEARHTDLTVFLEVFAPPRRMVIFGAVDFTAALVRVAKVLGYRVTVCDARPVFATAARFPEADEVVVDWPHRYLAKVADRLGPRDAVCVLTHDHKFDVPAIVAALDTRVGYLGAMGSRRTHAGRVERLRAEGVDDARLAHIMAPIGIDIGARTPEETAVAICAEIISLRAGVPVSSLRDGSGPIHQVPA